MGNGYTKKQNQRLHELERKERAGLLTEQERGELGKLMVLLLRQRLSAILMQAPDLFANVQLRRVVNKANEGLENLLEFTEE